MVSYRSLLSIGVHRWSLFFSFHRNRRWIAWEQSPKHLEAPWCKAFSSFGPFSSIFHSSRHCHHLGFNHSHSNPKLTIMIFSIWYWDQSIENSLFSHYYGDILSSWVDWRVSLKKYLQGWCADLSFSKKFIFYPSSHWKTHPHRFGPWCR